MTGPRLPWVILLTTLAAFSTWALLFLAYGPDLALNHDELNFLYDGLRLPLQGRLSGYAHGPLLYELIALMEGVFYLTLRLVGVVHSPTGFLERVIEHQPAHLAACRSLALGAGLVLLVQVFRLGRLFGGVWTGALASLLCGVNLTFLTMVSLCKEDVLYWLLLVTAALLLGESPAADLDRRSVFGGLCLGAAAAAKYLGVFSIVLAMVPLCRLPKGERQRGWRAAAIVIASAVAAFIALHPFVFLRSGEVAASIEHMDRSTASLREGLTLGTYLFVHLPNLVGWPILVAAVVEVGIRLRRETCGPVSLVAGAAAPLLFLGLRSGFSMAYYIFPMAVFAFILASALAVRLSSQSSGRLWPKAILIGLALLHPAFLPGAAKQALILTAPDTRIVTRQAIESFVPPGSCVVVGGAIVNETFWGPPLLPMAATGPAAQFEAARRQAVARTPGPRYAVRLVNGLEVDPAAFVGCEWFVQPSLGRSSPVELSPSEEPPSGKAEDRFPGVEFSTRFRLEAVPPPHSPTYPCLTELDYQELTARSLRALATDRLRGPNLVVARRTREQR